MKNSFFLVIPEQQNSPYLSASYEKTVVTQWVSELPSANLSLSTRLLHDYIAEFNAVEMPAQKRLEALEILEPHFLSIEDYLRSRLINSGFPKGTSEQKILALIVAIEKNFTIAYWMVLRELSGKNTAWFQGKNVALAIQRTIKGLSSIIVTQYMMFAPIPDWVWIDLHSLYKLSVKIKKNNAKVNDVYHGNTKVTTAEESYKQILMLSLSDPSGLMQKEVQQVYHFIGKISSLVKIENHAVTRQSTQCVILMDEDVQPYFNHQGNSLDSSTLYLNFLKLNKGLQAVDKFCSQQEARFSSMQVVNNTSEKLPVDLFNYLVKSWQGIELKGNTFFSDRLDRYIAVGLDATHSLQDPMNVNVEPDLEILAESFSDRELSCKFEKEGVLSIGSLVSFRQIKEKESKRSLGVVIKITMPKQDGHIVFELVTLTAQSYAVSYQNIDADQDKEPHKALLYGTKNGAEEKSFIILESFSHQNDDILRLNMNGQKFPIVLGFRKNIGLGYWQFECRRIESGQTPEVKAKKSGYDFI